MTDEILPVEGTEGAGLLGTWPPATPESNNTEEGAQPVESDSEGGEAD